jgi:hypothetical protein
MDTRLPQAPISGMYHLNIERREEDNGIMIFRNDLQVKMNEDFYKPPVLQVKDKIVQRRSMGAAFQEKKNEINRAFGKFNLYYDMSSIMNLYIEKVKNDPRKLLLQQENSVINKLTYHDKSNSPLPKETDSKL